MRQLQTEILVIGGGSTGTGVAWDAALRGFSVVLVEKRDLTHGTTGRYHGLLHSGGRYVVKDPRSAEECIQENRILRQTHTHCIEDTGGFFVVTPEDEGDYPDRFVAACAKVGIPYAELSISAARKQEPLLNPAISRVFQVPDAAADSFLATHATAQAARQAGATLLVYHETVNLLTQGSEGDRRVVGATVRDMTTGEEVTIHADMVINASGAWAGKIAHLAGVEVKIIPGKGVMVAMNHRIVNTVLNRCKMPADGDIIVPIHTVAVIGTTDEKVSDPERLTIAPWEVALMLACAPSIKRALSAKVAMPRVPSPCSTTASATASVVFSPLPGANGQLFASWQRPPWTKPVSNSARAAPAPRRSPPFRASPRGTIGWAIACTKSKRIICNPSWSANVNW